MEISISQCCKVKLGVYKFTSNIHVKFTLLTLLFTSGGSSRTRIRELKVLSTHFRHSHRTLASHVPTRQTAGKKCEHLLPRDLTDLRPIFDRQPGYTRQIILHKLRFTRDTVTCYYSPLMGCLY